MKTSKILAVFTVALLLLAVMPLNAQTNYVSPPKLSVPGYPYEYYPYAPYLIPSNGMLVMEDVNGRQTGDQLKLSWVMVDPQYDYFTDPIEPRVIISGSKVYVYGKVTGFSILRSRSSGNSTSVVYNIRATY